MNDRYFTVNRYFRSLFQGQKVRKIPINAGFSCPNKDGTLDINGCTFCDEYGSGPLEKTPPPISDQVETFIHRHPGNQFIAYFQAHSNTYAPPETLRKVYSSVLEYPQVVGISIGTRPDCINKFNLQVIDEISHRTHVSVELGLQSIHESSLKTLNRNHDYPSFLSAFHELKALSVDTVVHLILGIPGESREMMRESIMEMNRLLPRGVKLHMLHVLKNTTLEQQYRRNEITLFRQSEYTELVADLLELLDPRIVIHRLTGERNREIFVAPQWAQDKPGTLRMIGQILQQRDSWQGKFTQKAKNRFGSL